jgi:hypothetical protein
MDPQYILLICAAGVFALLLIIYIISSIEHWSWNRRDERELRQSYLDSNLKKMDYDLALGGDENRNATDKKEGQLTIDEVMTSDGKSVDDEFARKAEEVLFAKIENEGMEEIVGHYKP